MHEGVRRNPQRARLSLTVVGCSQGARNPDGIVGSKGKSNGWDQADCWVVIKAKLTAREFDVFKASRGGKGLKGRLQAKTLELLKAHEPVPVAAPAPSVPVPVAAPAASAPASAPPPAKRRR